MVETNIMFDGVSEVLGADVFLSDGTAEHLDKARLEEPLFHSLSENADASAGQLLTAFFKQSGTSPQDYVTREAMNEAAVTGLAVARSTLEARFDGGFVKFRQGEKLADLERVTFDLQLTVRPHQSG